MWATPSIVQRVETCWKLQIHLGGETIAGDHSKSGLRHTRKPKYFRIFTTVAIVGPIY